MAEKFTRRDFIKGSVILVGGSAVAALAYLVKNNFQSNNKSQITNTDIPSPVATKESNQTAIPTTTSYSKATPTSIIISAQAPQLSSSPTGLPGVIGERFPGRVVQVSHSDVHSWNYRHLNYWEYVNQSVVDDMVDQGMMNLTGQSNITDAWRSLIPNYQSGEVVAIKVSFNNTYDEGGSKEMIDGIIEPINAIIRGLNAIGVPNASIVVYDSSRWLPKRFTEKCAYPGALFRYSRHDPWGAGSSAVEFTPPGVSAFTQQLSKEATQASYLINIPVMKMHGMAALSLAMKNHYGSIERPQDLHQWSSLASPDFSSNYSPIVDLNNNAHIRNKTVLTVGDGIFASMKNNVGSFPRAWVIFGSQTPKCLFFATDPVAIDCVMGDILDEEKIAFGKGEIKPEGFAYLSLAEKAGLGVFERGNPLNNTYTKINLIKLAL